MGTATRIGIQLTIAFFGLFYLLVAPAGVWPGIRPFIPFSAKNAELLRTRFRDVTFCSWDSRSRPPASPTRRSGAW